MKLSPENEWLSGTRKQARNLLGVPRMFYKIVAQNLWVSKRGVLLVGMDKLI